MAALPYQFRSLAAPRRRVLGSAWRSATCVALAITSLMAAAITWTPVTAAAPCPGAPSPSSTSAANCQPQTAKLALFSSRMGVFASDDVRYVAHLPTPHGTAHVARKTVRVASASYDNGGSGTGGSSSSVAAATGGLPCQQSYMFVSHISQWTVPPGCYANIYYPDRTIYHAPGNFGFCNWWVLALHPNQPDLLYGKEYTRTSKPVPGAAIWFDPNVQGASSDGHWAEAVAVSPDGYWVLITEMNFGWRGGGFGRVDFRYIHVGPGVVFIY